MAKNWFAVVVRSVVVLLTIMDATAEEE